MTTTEKEAAIQAENERDRLLDNNLSPRIAHCPQALFDEHRIVSLREKFVANAPDVESPRSLFQMTAFNRDNMRKLVRSINLAAGPRRTIS
jgi:hypothetical protein